MNAEKLFCLVFYVFFFIICVLIDRHLRHEVNMSKIKSRTFAKVSGEVMTSE